MICPIVKERAKGQDFLPSWEPLPLRAGPQVAECMHLSLEERSGLGRTAFLTDTTSQATVWEPTLEKVMKICWPRVLQSTSESPVQLLSFSPIGSVSGKGVLAYEHYCCPPSLRTAPHLSDFHPWMSIILIWEAMPGPHLRLLKSEYMGEPGQQSFLKAPQKILVCSNGWELQG